MKMFGSDNNSGAHPRVMEALVKENSGHAFPYGEDETTKKAKKIIQDLIGKEADINFVTTGTSANIIGLSGLIRPFEAVVAPESAHINQDECNALERFNGSTIIEVPSEDGKIRPEDVKPLLVRKGERHASQAKIISISQVSELGTIYTLEEIKALADFAHANDMYLHMDGARLANAVEALDCSLKEMIGDTGVDLLSFGGTKNGMLIGEAIVCLSPGFEIAHKYTVKQGMQLLSKMRFIAAQFIAYLEDDLWLKNAKQANQMGRYLKAELEKINGVEVLNYDNNNMLFIKLRDKKMREELSEKLYFYTTNEEENIIRLITSYDIEEKDIDSIVSLIK